MHLIRSRASDRGFTLVELLIAVSIIGLITVPVGNFVINYFRNSAQSTQRLNTSHDIQTANAYWQEDIASLGVRSTSYDTSNNTFPTLQSLNNAFPCGLPSGVSSPLIVIGWNEYDTSGQPSAVNVAYATASSGAQLVRLRCNGSTLASTTYLVDNLVATPTCDFGSGYASCGSNAGTPSSISIKLTLDDPAEIAGTYTAILSGQRRQNG